MGGVSSQMSAMLSHIYLLLFTSLLLTNRDTVQGQYNGAVRLWRNGQTSLAYTFGRVQVFLKGQWGNVCWDSNADSVFTKQEADVTCRNLGYVGSSYYSTSSNDNYGVDPSPTLMYRVQCPLTDHRLLLMSCSHDADTISPHCTDTDDVGVLCYSSRIWFDPYPGMVRLSGGDYVNEGLVEIYFNGVWGKVCNLLPHDANTICKQLGYTSSPLNTTLVGLPSQVHWYNSLQCSSLSECIHECSSPPATAATCFHSAYIHCEYSVGNSVNNLYSCDTRQYPVGGGAIRLFINGNTSTRYTAGIVQVFVNGQWSNICRKGSFSLTEAHVLCHQLGYSNALSWSYVAQTKIYGTDGHPPGLSNVVCSSSDFLTIQQCSQGSTIDPRCIDGDDVIVRCSSANLTYSGMIRLSDGSFSNEGRVLVYCNNEWRTVCDNGLSPTDASVICRQLGYTDYINYESRLYTGSGLWFDSLQCSSTTDCIADCLPTDTCFINTCSHNYYPYIRCNFNSTKASLAIGSMNNCFLYNGEAQSGAVILERDGQYSLSHTSGRVAVYGVGASTVSSRFWGNICRRNTFSLTAANVICHQLSYTGAITWSYAAVDLFGMDRREALLGSVSCSRSDFISLFQCSMSTVVDSDCTDADDISVACYSTRIWNNPYPGQVRLSNGVYANEGLLEVYCNGVWGTVCQNTFTAATALAVCKQLGYSTYYRYNHLTIVGSSSQPIWLNSFTSACYYCISQCQACPTSVPITGCVHAQDVTLTCYSPSWNDPTYITNATCSSSSAATPTPTASDEGGGLSGGGIAGIVIGVVVFVISFTLFMIHVTKKK